MNTIVNTLIATLIAGSTAMPIPTQPSISPPSEHNLIVFEQTEEEKATEQKKMEEEKAMQLKQQEEEAAKELVSTFTYELSSFSTKYSTSKSNANRNYNMKLASDAIDGVILYPGDTFSYNDTILSKRNPSDDYLAAPIISNGKMVNATGGGICQISSTLFNSALYSGMTITSRRNHSLMVGYVPAGRDATASWGSIDFCFRNDLDMPVMITSQIGDGTLEICFLSTEEINLPEIKLSSYYKNGYYYLDRYVGGEIDYSTKSKYKG